MILKWYREIAGSRDSTQGHDAIAKRAIFGFGQAQGKNSFNSETYNGHFLTFPLVKFLKGAAKLPDNLMRQLGKLLCFSQNLLDKAFHEQDQIMNNSLRTWLMGMRFNISVGFPRSHSRFEFVDVFVESKAGLNRHCDGKNDSRAGYDYGASYSQILHHQEREYRLNFIMTTRKDCGKVLEKIQNSSQIL
jgi:hypothetical protein